MRRHLLCGLAAVPLLLTTSTSESLATGPASTSPMASAGRHSLVIEVHSVYEARNSLYGRGYYDVHTERASLPYSFNACKRGVRFHVHVGYYGEIVERDAIGPCHEAGYERYDFRPRPRLFPRYRYQRYDDRY